MSISNWDRLCAWVDREPRGYVSIPAEDFAEIRAVIAAAGVWCKFCDEDLRCDKPELTMLRAALRRMGALR